MIQNSAPCVLIRTKSHSPITPVLADPDWLLAWQQLDFKILIYVSNPSDEFITCEILYNCWRHRRLPHLMKQVGNDPRRRIAAHLTASKALEGKNMIWQNEADSTFAEGVEFTDYSLVIKTPGRYFVYTQVVFYSRGCQNKTVYLSHELAKLSPSYPEEALLLRAIKSACHSRQHGEPWYKTSYQGAIFEFEEGDQIYSRVSEEVVGYVDTAQGKSFFGIFVL
ncbi:tumor necrosis factor-like [Heterodontus francisci]|uniref:tumor necrosis factor-like n=1 Tax=Heterodontus francisci TaxID=7792 RepID=UPI00355B8835